MEPMVIFSAGLLVYFTYCTVAEALEDLQRERAGEMLRATMKKARSAGKETAAVACVVGMEKLSKILAIRSKRFKQLPAHSSLTWRQGAL